MLLATMPFILLGCGDDASENGTVQVFAAASLAETFAEIESAFEAANPGLDVRVNLAGSSSLREQILAGAPADVFASANEPTMEDLARADELNCEPEIFALNTLEIAVPAGNPGRVSGIEDFANGDLLIGLCAPGVPCGDFARQVLSNAGVEPSIDTNEPDVRALMTKIEADELDVGLVYVTDVNTAGERVEGIKIADRDNVIADYPIAELAHAPNPRGAAAFVDFVVSDKGRAIMSAGGFIVP